MMKSKSATTASASGASLTASQAQGLERIAHYAVLHALGLHEVCGISTRPFPLVIGPSGCGKTHLVQHLARRLERPFFSLNLHNWIVRGAKNDQQITLDQLAAFVRNNDEGVILLDEVNKLTSAHSSEAWSASVLSELLALLDMDERLDVMGLAGLRGKLREKFLLVGAAAFQDEWNASGAQKIGFGAAGAEFDPSAFEQAVRTQRLVPDELLYRFNDQLIVLAPPTREEFVRGIVAVRCGLALPALPDAEAARLAGVAMSGGKMMRWLEAYAAECTRAANPKVLHELGREQAQRRSAGAGLDPAAVERARKKRYDDAYAIYGMRLEKLAVCALEAAALVKELHYVAGCKNGNEGWAKVNAVLRGAEKALVKRATSSGLSGALRDLACKARQISLPSLRSDTERGRLAEAVTSECKEFSRWFWAILGPLNRHIAGTQAMQTLAAFLGAADACCLEHENLLKIADADLAVDPTDTGGDSRLRWLLPSGSGN